MPAIGRGTGRASMLYAFRRNLRGAEGACGAAGIPGIDQAPAPMSDAGPDEGPGRVVDREEAAQGATFVRDACVDAVVVPTFVDLADAAGRLADFVAPNPRSVHALPDGRGPFDAWGGDGNLLRVHRDAGSFRCGRRYDAGDLLADGVDDHQACVLLAGHEAHLVRGECASQGLLIFGGHAVLALELRLEGFAEAGTLGGQDLQHHRALHAGKDAEVDRVRVGLIVPERDGTGRRATTGQSWSSRFASGNGLGISASRDENADMGDVHHQLGANVIGDGTEALKFWVQA